MDYILLKLLLFYLFKNLIFISFCFIITDKIYIFLNSSIPDILKIDMTKRLAIKKRI